MAALLAFRIGPGEAIFFWGCVGHALYTPLARRLNQGDPPIVQTGMTLAAGLLLQLAHGAGDIAATVWAGLPAIVWITILSRRSWSGSRSSAFTRSAPTF